MTCTNCGYMMGPFDQQCGRCSYKPGDAPKTFQQTSAPSATAPIPAVNLISCPACAQMVSAQAVACPKCGQPIAAVPQMSNIPRDLSVRVSNNDSGRGATAVLPAELHGFNIGAAGFGWMWAIAHNTWIGLVALIPYVGLIMCFILGFKGNEWAWQNRRWESVAQFKQVQATWSQWSFIVFVLYLVIACVDVWLFTHGLNPGRNMPPYR